mgnify:FL=1|jgi:protease-4
MSTKKIILIIVAVLIVLIALSFWTGRQMSKFSPANAGMTPISAGSWLHLNPKAYVPEYSEIMPINWFGMKEMNSMQGLVAKIRAAKNDKRIEGILIEPMGVQISYASLNELELAIQDFKTSGKPVVAFGDMMGQGDYMLASFADQVYMDPSASAGLLLTGSSANVTFYKELFDKIGVKMHVIQAGEFKGAGEPYSQTSLSEGTRANIAEALSDRFNLLVDGIAKRRNITTYDVLAVYNNRDDLFISAKQALQMKLIDKADSRQALMDQYAIGKDKLVSFSSYTERPELGKNNLVAVIYLEGNIMPGYGSMSQSVISHEKVRRIVKSIEDDPAVKAVVVRVNSPGGSALESEYIYRELKHLSDKVPMVISMGGTAASGGYYISCAGQYIYADPGTLTGSIGVIMMLPELTGLSRKVGLRSQTIKYGKFAGALNPMEAYSPELIASLKRNSQGTYDEFKARVMTARNISPDKINSIAEGRVYSAEDAMAIDLVDEIGSLDTAIAKAAELAKLSDYRTGIFPIKKSIFEFLKDSDFMNMQIKNLLKYRHLNLEELTDALPDMIETNSWLYLMPIKVD